MASERKVHWYIGPKCNVNPPCKYCFAPTGEFSFSQHLTPENLERIARKLVKEKVTSCVLGGGEPLLVTELPNVLKILKEGGITTAVHTNGTLFFNSPEKLDELKELADDIAIPLDSFDQRIQEQLRPYEAIPIFEYVFRRILENKTTRVGIHTVATTLNLHSISRIYERIRHSDFDYWNIYEFDPTESILKLFCKTPIGGIAASKIGERLLELRDLAGIEKTTGIIDQETS